MSIPQSNVGKRHQDMVLALEDLQRQSDDVEWMDGYEIKGFILDLIDVLKKG